MPRSLDDADWFRPREAARLEGEAAQAEESLAAVNRLSVAIRQGAIVVLILFVVGVSTFGPMMFEGKTALRDWATHMVLWGVGLTFTYFILERLIVWERQATLARIQQLRLEAMNLRAQHQQLQNGGRRLRPG